MKTKKIAHLASGIFLFFMMVGLPTIVEIFHPSNAYAVCNQSWCGPDGSIPECPCLLADGTPNAAMANCPECHPTDTPTPPIAATATPVPTDTPIPPQTVAPTDIPTPGVEPTPKPLPTLPGATPTATSTPLPSPTPVVPPTAIATPPSPGIGKVWGEAYRYSCANGNLATITIKLTPPDVTAHNIVFHVGGQSYSMGDKSGTFDIQLGQDWLPFGNNIFEIRSDDFVFPISFRIAKWRALAQDYRHVFMVAIRGDESQPSPASYFTMGLHVALERWYSVYPQMDVAAESKTVVMELSAATVSGFINVAEKEELDAQEVRLISNWVQGTIESRIMNKAAQRLQLKPDIVDFEDSSFRAYASGVRSTFRVNNIWISGDVSQLSAGGEDTDINFSL